MSIKKEKISGKMVEVTINSSSLSSATYDSLTEDLNIKFKSGSTYQYKKVPWITFTNFRLAESQGKFFMKNIKENFKFKKIS
jgi:hypothetical protein